MPLHWRLVTAGYTRFSKATSYAGGYLLEGTNGLDAVFGASTLPGKRKESERELRPDSVWWGEMDSNHRSH